MVRYIFSLQKVLKKLVRDLGVIHMLRHCSLCLGDLSSNPVRVIPFLPPMSNQKGKGPKIKTNT